MKTTWKHYLLELLIPIILSSCYSTRTIYDSKYSQNDTVAPANPQDSIVTVRMKNNRRVTGVISREADDSITLTRADGSQIELQKKWIERIGDKALPPRQDSLWVYEKHLYLGQEEIRNLKQVQEQIYQWNDEELNGLYKAFLSHRANANFGFVVGTLLVLTGTGLSVGCQISGGDCSNNVTNTGLIVIGAATIYSIGVKGPKRAQVIARYSELQATQSATYIQGGIRFYLSSR